MLNRTRGVLALKGNGVIGIRREDKNPWERRVALTPKHVRALVAGGVRVLVQPSRIRCYTDEDYLEAGAEIAEDLSPAHTIIAVKEVPADLLLRDRTYLFFSHTHKAQPYNMPMLDTVLERNIRLIDFERIVNQDGRVVKFGPYAGYAGTIDTLHGLGLALLARGFATPFLHVSLAKEYRSLDSARQDLLALGEIIRTKGLPREICPLTIVVTGTGSVSSAAQQILHALPCNYIDPNDLKSLFSRSDVDRHCVYVAVATAQHMVQPKDPNKPFNKADYYRNPKDYLPVFHENVAPYAKVIINGIYWEEKYHKLLTTEQARTLHQQHRLPLLALGDITCDPNGSIELFVKATTIADPLYCYDMQRMGDFDMKEINKDSVVVLGVDHLPAEFPNQASTFFGDPLVPLAKAAALSDGSKPFAEQTDLPPELRVAVIAAHGRLTPGYEYIAELRKQTQGINHERGLRRILILGAGMVAGPVVRYLLKDEHNAIVIADQDRAAMQRLVEAHAPVADAQGRAYNRRVTTALLNVDHTDLLNNLVKDCDVVISLLPWTLHARIMPYCVANGKHMLTTSYENADMQQFAAAAQERGLLFLNELGLDPGIDIMSTIAAIQKITKAGGVVESYESYCGALPSPEHSANPLGYKFSWSPVGVLQAASRDARWLWQGQLAELPGAYLYNAATPFPAFPGLNLVAVPNGDSTKYKALFGFDDRTHTVMRGTYRYNAFIATVEALKCLGLLGAADVAGAATWRELLQRVVAEFLPALARGGAAGGADLAAQLAAFLPIAGGLRERELAAVVAGSPGLRQYLRDRPAVPVTAADLAQAVHGLRELALLDADAPVEGRTAVEALCRHLLGDRCPQLRYQAHERDFVLMHHRLRCRYPAAGGGGRRTTYRMTLSQRGAAEASATAATVGLPVAIGTQLLLDGHIAARGLCRPTAEEIYQPVLRELASNGIRLLETEVEELH